MYNFVSKVQQIKRNVFSIYLFPLIALHVSGGSSAHHQEHKTLHTALGIVKPILLPAAIVDEMELSTISSTIAAGSSIGLTIPTYSFVLLMMDEETARNMLRNL